MVADQLDALCAEFSNCITVAFADLATQMVLVTNSTSRLRREVLNELCVESGLTLGSDEQTRLGHKTVSVAFTASPNQTKVFLRATDEPDDILFCACNPDIDLEAFLPAAQSCLLKISGGAA